MADPENPSQSTTEQLACPSCGKGFDGAPAACAHCGGDLRGLGEASDTLSGGATPPPGEAATWGPEPGTVIDRRYRIKEKLGEGGMGSVYKVEHVLMGKIVALKLLRPEVARDRGALKRFHQEARIVSRLSHPNTVSVFDFGELPDGSLYMAMEYVPGRDLASLLLAEGALSERRAVSLAVQVLRSLAEAHDAGIVHRDIKPANVMLLKTREGEDFVKVVDFGIAQLTEAARAGDRRSTGGADFVGTPHYMSPEQVRGEPLDARSDLYSVGAMLFELLTNRLLFTAPSPLAVASKHLTEPPPRPREVAPELSLSPAVEDIVLKALSKDRDARYPTADAMRDALLATREPGAGGLSTSELLRLEQARPITGGLAIAGRDDWDQFESSLRRRRRVAPLVAAALLAAGGVAGWRLVVRGPAARPRVPVTMEVEPNDGPRTANLILPGTDVQGFIQRTSRDHSDQDLFEFEAGGHEPWLASISVTGVPNVNLAMDLFAFPSEPGEDGELSNLGHVDDRFLGGGERLSDLKLAPGRYLVRLEDKRRVDEGPGAPRENSLDPYTLRVELAPLPRFFEEEPDNTLEQAMRFRGARPIYGHAGAKGESAQVVTATGDAATLAGRWSDDYYELLLPSGATTGCALLAGIRGATLGLSVVATDFAKIRAIGDASARGKALAEHQARLLAREKPGRVTIGEVERRCARATESIHFKVQVLEGDSDERYVLVAVDDSEEGFAGLLSVCPDLASQGEGLLCRQLISKALQALPASKSAEAARSLLASLPQ